MKTLRLSSALYDSCEVSDQCNYKRDLLHQPYLPSHDFLGCPSGNGQSLFTFSGQGRYNSSESSNLSVDDNSAFLIMQISRAINSFGFHVGMD